MEIELPHVADVEKGGLLPAPAVFGQNALVLDRHIPATERRHQGLQTNMFVHKGGRSQLFHGNSWGRARLHAIFDPASIAIILGVALLRLRCCSIGRTKSDINPGAPDWHFRKKTADQFKLFGSFCKSISGLMAKSSLRSCFWAAFSVLI